MSKRVGDQVVVITGASSGVGRACVRAFASKGARIGLIARNEEALWAAENEVREAGSEALALPLDVADAGAVEEAAQKVIDRFGAIDTWVNDAMVSVFSPVKEMTVEGYKRVTDVSYLGAVYGSLSALRRMTARDEGTIIQICSALAYRSIPLQSAYCASKAAMRAFSDSLRCELIHDGSHVRVSVLILPAVNTPQFNVVKSRLPRHPQPVPPIYQPEMIAQAAMYAAEHPVREMTIGGGALKAVVGQKFIPGLLDHYLARTGYGAQQTNEPVSEDRPNNLMSPVPGDHGAHGAFDARSRTRSLQFWMRTHEGLLAAVGLAALAGAGLGVRQGSREKNLLPQVGELARKALLSRLAA